MNEQRELSKPWIAFELNVELRTIVIECEQRSRGEQNKANIVAKWFQTRKFSLGLLCRKT